jgi:tetratricopeptide (TPR) repeat protein
MKMEKLNRFVAKYVWIVYWAWVICLVVLWGVSVWLGMSQVVATFLLVGFVWLGARWIFTRDQALRRAQVACMFNQCDPYPFLEEAKRQLLYQGTKPMKLTRLIDYSTALLEVGEVEQAYTLLYASQEDAHRNDLRDGCCVYYHNLALASLYLGKWQEMEHWHEKLMENLQRLRSDQQKHAAMQSMAGYFVDYHHARQEYDQSMQILKGMVPANLRQQVAIAMHYARHYLAMGETEKVKEALAFVVGNGNKLYAVQEARQMLAEIEETTLA